MDNNEEHWQIVNRRDTIISTTPEGLWEQGISYFKWVDDNPIQDQITITSGKEAGKQVTRKIKRPYTIKALCLHCGLSEKYLKDILAQKDSNSNWYHVVEKLCTIVYNQNLEGGITGLFNPIMVSKVLNLDKPDDGNLTNVKVEVIDSRTKELPNSENEIIKNLDFGKVELLKEKSANFER